MEILCRVTDTELLIQSYRYGACDTELVIPSFLLGDTEMELLLFTKFLLIQRYC